MRTVIPVGGLAAIMLEPGTRTSHAAVALAASPRLARLTELDLRDNRITDVGAVALAGSPHLAQLDEISLYGNPISRAARAELRERFGERVRV